MGNGNVKEGQEQGEDPDYGEEEEEEEQDQNMAQQHRSPSQTNNYQRSKTNHNPGGMHDYQESPEDPYDFGNLTQRNNTGNTTKEKNLYLGPSTQTQIKTNDVQEDLPKMPRFVKVIKSPIPYPTELAALPMQFLTKYEFTPNTNSK